MKLETKNLFVHAGSAAVYLLKMIFGVVPFVIGFIAKFVVAMIIDGWNYLDTDSDTEDY